MYGGRPFDRVELAKSGRSTCRLCYKKIPMGSMRVALHTPHGGGEYWNCYLYHKECIVSSEEGIQLIKSARFENNHVRKRKADMLSSVENESERVLKKQRESGKTIQSRNELREELRMKRLSIAEAKNVPPYFLFNNETLDSLVEHLPSNKDELLTVKGFGQKKCEYYGPIFLPIIRRYKHMVISNRDEKQVRGDDGSESDEKENELLDEEESESSDDEEDKSLIIEERTFSLNDVIERKMKEAKNQGRYIVLE